MAATIIVMIIVITRCVLDADGREACPDDLLTTTQVADQRAVPTVDISHLARDVCLRLEGRVTTDGCTVEAGENSRNTLPGSDKVRGQYE
jgi:hypothetical protein